MKHTGLATKIREAMRALGSGGSEITNPALAVKLDMVFDNEKQVLYRALRDFVKSGEITRIRRGVYIYNGKDKPPELQAIMWRYLRVKKTVTIDDLVETSGASREYAIDWVQMLERQQIVEKIRTGHVRKYRLISDPVIMPVNEKNRDKLRKLREQKKSKTLAALRVAELAIREAKEMISSD